MTEWKYKWNFKPPRKSGQYVTVVQEARRHNGYEVVYYDRRVLWYTKGKWLRKGKWTSQRVRDDYGWDVLCWTSLPSIPTSLLKPKVQ